MESKEIFAVILATLGIILVIGVLSLITKKDTETEQDPIPETTEITTPEPIYLQTDIWDQLREQNATTVTTDTTASAGSDMTGTETAALPEGTETAVTGFSDGNTVVTESAVIEGTDTTAAAEMTADTTVQTQQSYVLVLP